MSVIISWCFLLYFVLLYAERIRSLVLIIKDKKFAENGFEWYVNLVSIFSMSAAMIMLLGFNNAFWSSLFSNTAPDYKVLCATAGVLLLSGMVHTKYTVAPFQFAAYGALILGMILRTAEYAAVVSTRAELWYSLIFTVVFSMAIPVVYPSPIKNSVLFCTTEAVTSVALVSSFTVMLTYLFTGSTNLLLWIPAAILLIGDGLILYWESKKKINTFLLIFAALSIFLFILGKILF